MDGNRFDELTRALAARQTARASRRAFLGGLAGAAASLLGQRAGEAACPPGQVDRRGKCHCKTTGRPPVNGICPCPAGQRDCGGGRCAACCADADCEDGNPCTTNTCANGRCRTEAVVCPPASDQCLVAVCQPKTGNCVEEPVADGTPCDDDDACTRTDTCQTGACVGANPVVCGASDECHEAGRCDPASGACSPESLKPGYCFVDGACVAAGAPNPANACEACDPAANPAGWSALADGTPCSDSNACTDTDTCQAGVCTPGTDVVCPPPGPCQEPGVCSPSTGCTYASVDDGTPCDDGDGCTTGTTCTAGVCGSGAPVVCTGPCEACSADACRSTCGNTETCQQATFGGTTLDICCPTGLESCVGSNGVLVCCGAAEICHEVDLGGLTLGVCCPAGQGCSGSNGLPVCCGAGEVCHESAFGGFTFGVCCAAEQESCPGLDGRPVCCGAGEVCHETDLGGFITVGVCCPSGQAGCAGPLGSTSPVCCGAGESCHETDLGGFITVGVCCATGRETCAGFGGVVCCGEGESCAAIPGLPADAGSESQCCPEGQEACATFTDKPVGICCAAGETCVGEYPNWACSPP